MFKRKLSGHLLAKSHRYTFSWILNITDYIWHVKHKVRIIIIIIVIIIIIIIIIIMHIDLHPHHSLQSPLVVALLSCHPQWTLHPLWIHSQLPARLSLPLLSNLMLLKVRCPTEYFLQVCWGKKREANHSNKNPQLSMTELSIFKNIAWENSKHLTMPPLVSQWNEVWETCAEIPNWWRVTTQIWGMLLIGRAAWEICFSQ